MKCKRFRSYNEISNIPDQHWRVLGRVRTVDLSHNNLNTVRNDKKEGKDSSKSNQHLFDSIIQELCVLTGLAQNNLPTQNA